MSKILVAENDFDILRVVPYGIGLASFHMCAGEERGGDFELFGGSAG